MTAKPRSGDRDLLREALGDGGQVMTVSMVLKSTFCSSSLTVTSTHRRAVEVGFTDEGVAGFGCLGLPRAVHTGNLFVESLIVLVEVVRDRVL